MAPDKVVDVTGIVVGVRNWSSDDFSHRTTFPVLPAKTRFAGEVPEQIVWPELTVPPTLTGLTFTWKNDEVAVAQEPLLTTALNLIFCDKAPEA